MTIPKLIMFVLVAIPGMMLLLFASLDLFANYYDKQVPHGNIAISCLLGILGLFLILIGVGEWGKWRYLAVFLTVPLSLLTYISLNLSFLDGKFAPVIFVGCVSFVVLHLVRLSYRNRQ